MVPDGRTDGRNGRTDGQTDGRTHGRRQNYIPPTSSGDNKNHCYNIASRSDHTFSRASCTIPSLSVSNADVASSKRRIFGSLTKALAMAILCFYLLHSYLEI